VIIYTKIIEENRNLIKLLSTDNGQTFSSETIYDNVDYFQTYLDGDDFYISYTNMEAVNTSSFGYFTDKESSENEDGGLEASVIKFWGSDVLRGPVHSNSDIYIQQAGGGNNDGWPVFHGLVSTAGRVRVFPGGMLAVESSPVDQIFRGGLRESVNDIVELELPTTAEEIRQNGTPINVNNADIIYLKIENNLIYVMFGDIVDLGVHEFDVYTWFPHEADAVEAVLGIGGNWYEDSNQIYTNQTALYDTVWATGPTIYFANESFWIEGAELWIEGCIEGKLTIGCEEDIYLTGDITYANTSPGDEPDDPIDYNMTDYFGLVTESKIFIKYKHKDPFENMELRDDNCNDIILYGAFAAIGEADTLVYGEMACHYDSQFTFEYQHPHGSTPNFWSLNPYTLEDTLFTYIDLHKFIFPPDQTLLPEIAGFNLHGNDPVVYGTCGYPYEHAPYYLSYPNNNAHFYAYPYGTDYPWYNPVWPESAVDLIMERGVVNIFGSLVQRRRGYVHRSGYDYYNHPSFNHEWEMENYHFGSLHYPTGYGKEYNNDSRFKLNPPLDFPNFDQNSFYPNMKIALISDNGNSFETICNLPNSFGYESYMFAVQNDRIAVIGYEDDIDYLVIFSNDGGENFMEGYGIFSPGVFELRDISIMDDKLYLLELASNRNAVFEVDLTDFDVNQFENFEVSPLVDFSLTRNGCKVYAAIDDFSIQPVEIPFHYTLADPTNFTGSFNWQTAQTMIYETGSMLALNFNDHDSVYVSILDSAEEGLEYGDLYLAKGTLPELTETDENQVSHQGIVTLSNYPNPFNPSTTISFNLSEDQIEKAELTVYNLKGQKVKTFLINSSTDQPINSVVWNGTDDNNKPVSTGIYFYKLKSGEFEKTRKMLLMK
ncbi:T9SS type A sorting domain-containing protein, partial [Candidatus Cloacimonadota bacterium]